MGLNNVTLKIERSPQITVSIASGAPGPAGEQGEGGAAATVSVGEVTTLAAGADATVTNVGTDSAAVFDFGIPQGEQGEQGIQGIQGEQGPAGADGLIQSIVAGTNITVDDTDPANPIISASGGGGSGSVDSVVAGTGIDVDDTDPANPEVSLDAATQASLALADSAVQQAGGTMTGTLNITLTASDDYGLNVEQSGPTTAGLVDNFMYNRIAINNDTPVAVGSAAFARTMGLYMQFNQGGSNADGAAYGVFATMNHRADSATGGDMTPIVGLAVSDSVDTSGGELYGANFIAFAESGSQLPGINGTEIDVGVFTGATITRQDGLRIVNEGDAQPSGRNSAVTLTSENIGGSFKHGLLLSEHFGANPLATTGTVFGMDMAAMTVANFAEFPNLTVTGDIFDFPHFKVTGAGVATVNKNTASLPGPGSAAVAHFGGADGAEANATIDSFGTGTFTAFSGVQFRRANGTAASRSAVQANDLIALFGGTGYGATAYSSIPRAQVRFIATENWTDTAQGEGISFLTTPSGGTSTAVAAQITHEGNFISAGSVSTSANTIKTGNYTVAATDSALVFNGAASITVTLPNAASYPGRWLHMKTIAAQTVVSASSNVIPLASNTAGTAILAATAGRWAQLQSNGTSWVIMAAN